MLFSIDDTDTPIINIPHEKNFTRWRARMADADYLAITAALEEKLGNETVLTSSWVPGSDWSGTVYEPIYTDACEYDPVAAALCFGLIVWVFMQSRDEAWSFGRYQKDGIDIRGLTYFRINIKS